MLWSMERGIPGKTDMQSKRQQTRKSVSQHNTVFENDTKMSHFNFVSKYLKLYILNVCIFAPKKAFTHCGKFQFLVHLLNLDQCNFFKNETFIDNFHPICNMNVKQIEEHGKNVE